MSEVLVVVEATREFGVKKVTLELLTLARELGTPAAVVLGGPGSLMGAFLASLAVGLADAFGKALLPTFAEFTMMGLVVLVLAWRPAGLFGAVAR